MKCAVRDSSWITLKRPLALQSSLFIFCSIISLVPERLQRFVCLIVSLMARKESLRLSGGLLLHCVVFYPGQIMGYVELVINWKFPALWLERSNHSCSLSVSSEHTCLYLSVFQCFFFLWYIILSKLTTTYYSQQHMSVLFSLKSTNSVKKEHLCKYCLNAIHFLSLYRSFTENILSWAFCCNN